MNNVYEQYKCPTCDGRVRFNAARDKFVCEFCGNEYDAEDFESKTSQGNGGELLVFKCSSCGAETIGSETTTSIVCPFCDNSVINGTKLKGEFKPKGILPFEISKKQALDEYIKHVSGIQLCPDSFLTDASVEEIRELYVPYFLFNIHTEGEGVIQETWKINDNGNRDLKLHRFKSCLDYIDVPHEGSLTLDDTVMKGIEPFNFKNIKEFSAAYLSGYTSDRYDDDRNKLRKNIYKQITKDVADNCVKIYQDNSDFPSHDFTCANGKNDTPDRFYIDENGNSAIKPFPVPLPSEMSETKVLLNYGNYYYRTNVYTETKEEEYVLCPVYIINMRYNGEIFRYVINGQTGKTVGRVPVDEKKNSKLKKKTTIKPILFGLGVFLLTGVITLPALTVPENMENPVKTSLVLIIITLLFGLVAWLIPNIVFRAKYKSIFNETYGKENAGVPAYLYLADTIQLNVDDNGFKDYPKTEWSAHDSWVMYERKEALGARSKNKVYVDWEHAEFLGKNKFIENRKD